MLGGLVNSAEDSADVGCLAFVGEEAALVVGGLAVLLVVLFFVVPLIVAALDVLIVLLLGTLGVVGRLLFRRPWVVEARPAVGGHAVGWRVVGWRASGEQLDRVVEHLLATGALPPDGIPMA
jgi:hypothetical protein